MGRVRALPRHVPPGHLGKASGLVHQMDRGSCQSQYNQHCQFRTGTGQVDVCGWRPGTRKTFSVTALQLLVVAPQRSCKNRANLREVLSHGRSLCPGTTTARWRCVLGRRHRGSTPKRARVAQGSAAGHQHWTTEEVASSHTVNTASFEEGLGRLMYVAGALEHERPFLSPLYSFLSLHPRGAVRKVPAYVKYFLRYLSRQVSLSRHYNCAMMMRPCSGRRTGVKTG